MLGDDISYYGYALQGVRPQEGDGLSAGFHFLRWTVWGPIWLFMKVFGPGQAAYTFLPSACLGVACALVFVIGRSLRGAGFGILAAAVLFFHPLINDLVARPMPDIVEGVLALGGLAVLGVRAGWWGRRLGAAWRSAWVSGCLLGMLAFLSWVNRPTGLIWVIAAAILSCIRPRRMLPALAVAGLVFAAGCLVEALVYRQLFGDFAHRITANLRATGRKGTDPVALWWLPFRFLDSLAAGGLAKGFLFVASVWGSSVLWRRDGVAGRNLVAWWVLLYLGISCAFQSLFPLRPMVREGERFIANLAFPMSLCAAAGLAAAWEWARPRLGSRFGAHPAPWAAAAIAILALASGRPVRESTYVPILDRWIRGAGDVMIMDEDGSQAAWVVNPGEMAKRRVIRVGRREIIRDPECLDPARLGPARDYITTRNRVKVSLRKTVESKEPVDTARLSRDLFMPGSRWLLADVAWGREKLDDEAAVLGSGRDADSVMFLKFRRIAAGAERAWAPMLGRIGAWTWQTDDPPRGRLERGPEDALRFERSGEGQALFLGPDFEIPEAWRGRVIETRIKVRSATAEPLDLFFLPILASGKAGRVQIQRQVAGPEPFHDFGGAAIPSDAVKGRVMVGVRSACSGFDVLDVQVARSGKAWDAGPR